MEGRDGVRVLSEADLSRAEQRMRVWIVNTIINPINDGIKHMNKELDTVASLDL